MIWILTNIFFMNMCIKQPNHPHTKCSVGLIFRAMIGSASHDPPALKEDHDYDRPL